MRNLQVSWKQLSAAAYIFQKAVAVSVKQMKPHKSLPLSTARARGQPDFSYRKQKSEHQFSGELPREPPCKPLCGRKRRACVDMML